MNETQYKSWKDVAAMVFPSAEDMEEHIILPTGTWMDSSYHMRINKTLFRPSLVSMDSIMLIKKSQQEDTTTISDTCTWIDEIII